MSRSAASAPGNASTCETCPRLCDWCPIVVNGVCGRAHHPFDLLISCFLPLYSGLAAAVKAAADHEHPPCVVTSRHLEELLTAIFGNGTFAFPQKCDSDLLQSPRCWPRRWEHPPSPAWRLLHSHILQRHMEWLGVTSTASLPPLYTVLISRVVTRQIEAASEMALSERLSQQRAAV